MVDSQRGTVKDLGKGYGGPPPLFWVKKEKITEGRKAGKASKKNNRSPAPLSLAQGLDIATGSCWLFVGVCLGQPPPSLYPPPMKVKIWPRTHNPI